MVGRVWPRHGHRGRPLNAIVRRHRARKMKPSAIFLAFALATSIVHAKVPECASPNQAPAKLALGWLVSAGLTEMDKVDTAKTKVLRLAAENIGNERYRQVHLITFTEKNGRTLEALTNSVAWKRECSMYATEVFVISQRLGK
jgi:hypothetical protein